MAALLAGSRARVRATSRRASRRASSASPSEVDPEGRGTTAGWTPSVEARGSMGVIPASASAARSSAFRAWAPAIVLRASVSRPPSR